MKHIYVSPHSDDVALSCGGQIILGAARGNDVLVLNIFRSDAEDAHSAPDGATNVLFDSINSDRTREDKAAWDSIGIEAQYANLPEALLRRKFPFSILPGRRDDGIANEIIEVLLSYIKLYPDALLYFPAGFGNHVDHLACTKAAFRLLDDNIVEKIMLYEDTPYSWLKFIRN
ncbi:MAG TPA: PIG-L family deacetylase, partial [Sphingomonas sp.]|nr:PIG-L family deacetylase [Sphingomonas sp.]